MRFAHRLQPNKTTGYPRHCIWFDVETNQIQVTDTLVEHHLSFGFAVHKRREHGHKWSVDDWFKFAKLEDFWDWVETKLRKNTRLDLYAHNAGFDLTVCHVWNELPKRGWKLKTSIIDAPPLVLIWRKDRYTIRCIDTLNYWRTSLKQLGKFTGLEKLEMPENWDNTDESDTYCKRDVEIIMYACMKWWKFISDNDLGVSAITLAAQAMQTFRHRFMKHEILIDDNEKALALAREAYKGGRVECFQIGKISTPVYHLDVNSMYPFVMRENEYPTKLIGYYKNVDIPELTKLAYKYAVVGMCKVDTPEPVYMLRGKERSICPIGRYNVALTTPEITYGLEHGYIHHCDAIAVYEKAPIFTPFVNEMYGLRMKFRQEGDKTGEFMVKILMNSLYGKFGQNGRVFEIIGETNTQTVDVHKEIDHETGIVYTIRQYAGIVECSKNEGESFNSHPAIAAHVVAYARMLLWGIIQDASPQNVYYCDTDCIMCNRHGKENLNGRLHADTLGYLKQEGIYDWVIINGAKDYQTPEYTKLKGVRLNAKWLDGQTVEQDKWQSVTGLLHTGKLDAPTTERITKTLQRVYLKGEVSSSGKVSPYRIAQW
jgi:hypothetical protein